MTGIDRFANRRIGGTGALGAHVALGCKAREQIVPGGADRRQGALRHGFLDGLQIFRARMQEQVNVRIDQARYQSSVAEVDDRRARWRRGRLANRLDAIAINDDFRRADNLAGFYFHQTLSAHHRRGLPRRALECRAADERSYQRSSHYGSSL